MARNGSLASCHAPWSRRFRRMVSPRRHETLQAHDLPRRSAPQTGGNRRDCSFWPFGIMFAKHWVRSSMGEAYFR